MSVNLHALQQHVLQYIRREMKRRLGARAAAVILLPWVVAAVVYWGYSEHRKRELPRTVSALVHDASLRLQDALSSDGDAIGANPKVAQRLDQHVVAVDRDLLKLRAMDTTAIEEFAGAADDYLLTTREILRRRAADYRYRMQLSESTGALRNHMRSDNRTGAWITQAVRTKERVEADYRDYRLTTEALAKLLGLFSASRAKLAPHVAPALLADESVVAAARSRALESFRKITDEVEKTGQLDAYR